MKRHLLITGGMCVLALLFVSCNPSGYQEDDMIGVWRCPTTGKENPDGYYYVVFNAEKDETGEYRLGKEWDEGDDVQEEEAQLFKWKLEVRDLTQIYWMEINETWGVPKYYTVTLLTNTALSFNNGNRTYTFEKVAEAEVTPTEDSSSNEEGEDTPNNGDEDNPNNETEETQENGGGVETPDNGGEQTEEPQQ